jgi:hypothetical protein
VVLVSAPANSLLTGVPAKVRSRTPHTPDFYI